MARACAALRVKQRAVYLRYLLADLFIAWLVLGLCVTVVRFLRKWR